MGDKEAMLSFRQAKKEDVTGIRALIQKRIDWMDQVGIHQWNETKYLEYYDTAYFENNISYFYVAMENDEMVGVVALYEEDERWPDKKPAIYVHHLTSMTNGKGIGKQLLDFSEEVAREKGFDLIRLDSDINNKVLEKFYTGMGYVELDTFIEGLYQGIRREKYLSKPIRSVELD